MEIYLHYWFTIEGAPEQSQALSWKHQNYHGSRKSCILAISILYKTQEPPKHQGEPRKDNQ